MKNKKLFLIYIINLMSEFKLYGVIIILYYYSITNSMLLSMSIFSITTITSSILELPTGLISDKLGRKKTIILGSLFSLFSICMLAMSNNYILLVIAAIFNGIEIAFFSGNNQAYIYDTLKEENMENAYNVFAGKANSMLYLSGAISALVGSILYYFTSYKFVICLSIIPKLLQLGISIILKDTKKTKREQKVIMDVIIAIKKVIKNKILKKQILADGLNEGIGEACYQFRSKFYEMVWPSWALGIPGIISNIGAFCSNWFAGLTIKKFGKKNIYIFSNFYSMLSNILGVLLQNIFSPIIMVTNSLFSTEVIQMELEQKCYDSEYRASMGSIKSFVKNLIFSLISILVGIIADCVRNNICIYYLPIIKDNIYMYIF